MPPLPYTWSHPDCPFTVDFPGEPTLEVPEKSKKNEGFSATYESKNYFLFTTCIPTIFSERTDYGFETDQKMAEEIVNELLSENIYKNLQIISIEKSIFHNLKPAIFAYKVELTQGNYLAQVNGIVFKHKNAMLMQNIGFGAHANTMLPNNGAEFFESVRLK